MQETFIWTEKYSVLVAEIDEQHRHFIEICNELVEFSKTKNFTHEQAFKLILRLGDYAFYHLGFEEELFLQTEYPDGPLHTTFHDKFRASVKKFIERARVEQIGKEAMEEIATFSVDWLLSHILYADKQYSAHFNQHGIK